MPVKRALSAHMILRAAAKDSLWSFLQAAWPHVEGTDLKPNWHLKNMCNFAQHYVQGEMPEGGVVSVSPSSGKTSVCSIYLPMYQWANDGGRCAFIYISYDGTLLNTQSDKIIEFMGSPIWMKAFPEVKIKGDKPAKGEFFLSGGGRRFNTTPLAKCTGRHFDRAVIDDALKAQDALSESANAAANGFVRGTLPTRGKDPKSFPVLAVGQRLSLRDVPEYYLGKGAQHLFIPMRYDPESPADRGTTFKDCKDPRKKPGQLMFPNRWGVKEVKDLEEALGPADSAAQLGQNPTAEGAGFVTEEDVSYVILPEDMKTTKFQQIISSWDFSAGGTDPAAHSMCFGELWGVTRELTHAHKVVGSTVEGRRLKGLELQYERIELKPNVRRYVRLDWVGGWWDYPTAKRIFKQVALSQWRYRGAYEHLVEAKASGAPIVQELGIQETGIVEVTPKGSKQERFRAQSAVFRNKCVLSAVAPTQRPDIGSQNPSLDGIRKMLLDFPRGTNDDPVDTCSQFLAHSIVSTNSAWEALSSLVENRHRVGGRRTPSVLF